MFIPNKNGTETISDSRRRISSVVEYVLKCHKDLSHNCKFIIVESGVLKPDPTEVYSRSIG
jgi:hypothetical protein